MITNELIADASTITVYTRYEYYKKSLIENKRIDIQVDHGNGTRDCFSIEFSKSKNKFFNGRLEQAFLSDYNPKKSRYDFYEERGRQPLDKKSCLEIVSCVENVILTMDLSRYSRPEIMSYFKKGLLKQ